ncbi:pRiA4b ORF-3-like protein [Methanobrevibacter millerae]|uniref:PRiA4b ORF-3-like protein n=1 Tax=Methanobrevibacter millerae TaxID=230361 RepID=A0A1G5VIR0_9EURY|nr:pRiA4b ORF-3-like protein [Methanobrevibacter millerae]
MKRRFFYEYDFGDGWAFTIEIKKIVDYDRDYPTIKRFKGDYNPIEDCGGVYGLELILYYKDHPDEAPDIYLEQINLLEKFNQEDIQDRLEDFKSDNDFFLL